MRNKILYYLKLVNIIGIFLFVGLAIGTILNPILNKYVLFPSTYVKSINTPIHSSFKVRKILEEFNSYGDNRIVNFESGIRPIIITESSIADKNGNRVVGQAINLPTVCYITLNPNMWDDLELKQVVIHEYIHCYGFDHTKDIEDDIMSPVYISSPREENIRHYARKLLKLLHE